MKIFCAILVIVLIFGTVYYFSSVLTYFCALFIKTIYILNDLNLTIAHIE